MPEKSSREKVVDMVATARATGHQDAADASEMLLQFCKDTAHGEHGQHCEEILAKYLPGITEAEADILIEYFRTVQKHSSTNTAVIELLIAGSWFSNRRKAAN